MFRTILRRSKNWIRLALPILTILWIAFILSRSLKTGDSSASESERYYSLLRSFIPGVTMFIVRKGAHFIEFFILGLLLFLDFRLLWKRSFWLPALCGLLVAVSDELLQLLVPERSGEIADMLLDFSGVAAACLLAMWISVIQDKRGKRHEREANKEDGTGESPCRP